MKILLTLDLFIWNYFIPNINAKIFKNRMIALLALVYVSMFKLPRKFLMNYFRGKGNHIPIDTKEFITGNYAVLNKLIDAISRYNSGGFKDGFLDICQTDVYDPNYKYSVGSFRINYSLSGENVIIAIRSNYGFGLYSDRITKHLHRWLYSLKTKGYTKDFKIEGNAWLISSSKLMSSKIENQVKKSSNFNFLI